MIWLVWYGYASIVICLLTVAAHDIANWLATRPVRVWIEMVADMPLGETP